MGNVHEGDARARGKIECRHARAVDIDGQVYKRRAVRFIVRRDAQGGNSILRKSLVPKPVELAFPGNAGQLGIDLGEIQRPRSALVSLFCSR